MVSLRCETLKRLLIVKNEGKKFQRFIGSVFPLKLQFLEPFSILVIIMLTFPTRLAEYERSRVFFRKLSYIKL